jgi:hypothetical protein
MIFQRLFWVLGDCRCWRRHSWWIQLEDPLRGGQIAVPVIKCENRRMCSLEHTGLSGEHCRDEQEERGEGIHLAVVSEDTRRWTLYGDASDDATVVGHTGQSESTLITRSRGSIRCTFFLPYIIDDYCTSLTSLTLAKGTYDLTYNSTVLLSLNHHCSMPFTTSGRAGLRLWILSGLAVSLVVPALGLGLGLGLGLKHRNSDNSELQTLSPQASNSFSVGSILGQPPQERRYNFTVHVANGAPDGVNKTMLVVNGG